VSLDSAYPFSLPFDFSLVNNFNVAKMLTSDKVVIQRPIQHEGHMNLYLAFGFISTTNIAFNLT
jgi:hypothetical protein